MASLALPNTASADEIEEEIEYQEVCLLTLDDGADDYAERRADIEAIQRDLEKRLAAAKKAAASSQTSQAVRDQSASMDASYRQAAGPSQQTWNNDSLSYNNNPYMSSLGQSTVSNQHPATMKRPFPASLHPDHEHPSKRQTPEPSNAGTPASSTDSFELIEHPTVEDSKLEQARKRQQAYEAALERHKANQRASAQFLPSLSQGTPSLASSSRPNVQTTLGYNGTFQRPPPRTAVSSQLAPPSIHVKAEPGSSSQSRNIPARPRPTKTEVIDLTNSEDEDEGLTEIAPTSFRPNPNQRMPSAVPSSSMRPNLHGKLPTSSAMPQHAYSANQMQYPHRQLPMPGSYPSTNSNGYQYVYGNPTVQPQQSNGWTTASQILGPVADALRNANYGFQDTFAEVNNLINGIGIGRANPVPLSDDEEDDSDVEFNGSRLINPGAAPYAGRDDLYRQRYDDIAHYNPAKTAEEIEKLLDNIRPDEEMPAHLRVQTPEAMSVKLHKYQELGLTWLQKCETGNNKGGVLADDMGLGKTIQMLSLIVTHKSEDPRCKTTLIVAPLALMRQWQQEIEQKVKPGRHRLTVYIQHGQSKKKDFRDLQHYDIVLTTYGGSLAAEVKKLENYELRKKQFPESKPNSTEKCALISDEAKWYRVILDEAQCIKNVKTQTAKAACRLQAIYRFCMSGTPMMNGVDEFYSLVKFLRIKPYNEWTKFRADISTPLRNARGEFGKERAMQMLQGLCRAVMLRRTKKSTFEGQPILVLPERTTEVVNAEFSEDEDTFYKALESQTQLTFNRYLARGAVGSQYSAILVLLLRLRQACCHPHLIRDFGVAAAAGITPEVLVDLAKELSPEVVARIKETGGNFECPVCYDGVTNPAIFIPCGHDTCHECFSKIADPANAIRDGNENATKAKCPKCRADVDPKRITDFDSFKKVHMPEALRPEELAELEQLKADLEAANEDSETDSETESETDDDDVDDKGNLAGFIVNDDEDSDDAASGDEDNGVDGVAGPSQKSSKPKKKSAKKSKKAKGKSKEKGKGKEKEKEKKAKSKTMTLAELKKMATRSASAKRAYLRRLRENWVTSAKIEKTMEKLREIMAGNEKVLIFSQWTSLLDLLEIPIDGESWGYRRYDGSMNPQLRADAVDDFRDHHKDVRIMLVSLKAGNAGLNLTMASQVIILDPFWNPYVEEQAIDRAHRLGQTRPVQVHRVLVEGTVEDRIIALQEKKRAIISTALDEKAGQNIARLGVQELAYLFGVTRNPAQRVDYQPRGRG